VSTIVEKGTEKIARRMAREAGKPEGLWELFLGEAYAEYYGVDGAFVPNPEAK
jgi:hypothetical protein